MGLKTPEQMCATKVWTRDLKMDYMQHITNDTIFQNFFHLLTILPLNFKLLVFFPLFFVLAGFCCIILVSESSFIICTKYKENEYMHVIVNKLNIK